MKKDAIPTLTLHPFFEGMHQTLTYWVDNGIRRRIVLTKPISFFIKLSPDLVSEMTGGNILTVRVKPIGDREREQRFSLDGFAAARKWLGGKTCQKKVPNRMEVEVR